MKQQYQKKRVLNDALRKNKYIVIQSQAVPKDIAEFCYKLLLTMQKELLQDTCICIKGISHQFDNRIGDYEGQRSTRFQNTYSVIMLDIAMETLLMRTANLLWKKKTGLKLNPTYSLMQEYINQVMILHRHKDRFSCEISTTYKSWW